jgi:hypothetical protein
MNESEKLKWWGKVGRDGKNRYCIYYIPISRTAPKRVVVASGLTKLAAKKMLELAKED